MVAETFDLSPGDDPTVCGSRGEPTVGVEVVELVLAVPEESPLVVVMESTVKARELLFYPFKEFRVASRFRGVESPRCIEVATDD
jgi:hypothetical protein